MSRLLDVPGTSRPHGDAALQRLGTRPGPAAYLRDLWARRQFAMAIAVGEARAQHMDTTLGSLWHVMNPILLVAVYYVVFGLILRIDRGVDNLLAFLTIGTFLFRYTSKSVTAASKAILNNEGLIRSMKFPRAVLPISTVLAHTVMFVPAVGVLVVASLATGERLQPTWLLLAPILALQLCFNVGLALGLSRLTHRFPDMQNVLPFVFRMLFYFSGVLFLASRYVDAGKLWLFELNPLYSIITIARGLVLDGTMSGGLWLIVAAWTAVVLLGGFVYFQRGEQDYGRG